MWDVGEKNIISVGVSLSNLECITKQNTQFNLIESETNDEFLYNFHLITNELNVIIIKFTDWEPDLIKLLNISKQYKSMTFLFIFENRKELNLNFDKMNRVNAFGIIKNDLMGEKVEQLLQRLGILSEQSSFVTAVEMNLETQTRIPILLQGISKNQIIIEKPSFSKEIEAIDFEVSFPELRLKFSSKSKDVCFSDNKILVNGDFSEIINNLETISIQSLPFIKVAIFTKVITKKIQDLYSLPNISVNLYNSPQDLDDDLDLIIINEVYIDNNPFSDEILRKCKLVNQKVVVFSAQSSSRAYQKVYKHKKILLHDSQFSVTAIADFIQLLQHKTEGDYYYLNEWNTLGLGHLLVGGEISMFNELEYNLKLPFKLSSTTILKTSFWNDITGDIVSCEKERNQYSHLVRFNNLSELKSNELRVFVNKVIFYQDHFKEKLVITNYENFTLPEISKKSA